MRPIRIAEDIVPFAEFKANASRLFNELPQRDTPLVVTQNGRPAAVVLSPAAYDQMREYGRYLRAIAEGTADLDAGRTLTTDEVRARLGLARGRAGRAAK